MSNIRINKTIIIFALLLSILFFSSCYKRQENTSNPFFIKAQNSYNDGNYNQASEFYQKYLTLYPESPKAHYNIAIIFLEHENYILAIFHFKQFLELQPNSPDKEIIKKWIQASQESLYKELEKEYSDTETIPQPNYTKNVKLKKEIDKLKKKNEKMRDFIIKHNKTITVDKNGKTEKANNFNSTRNYEVQQGDSLYKISKKVYNSSKYHDLIWEANKDKLKSPSSLRPGDILTIPPLKH